MTKTSPDQSVKTSPNKTPPLLINQAVRTNNDVEGWHGLLNRHAKKGNLSFYIMTALLYEQSRLTDLQVRLILDAKLQRRQRRKYRQLQGQLFALATLRHQDTSALNYSAEVYGHFGTGAEVSDGHFLHLDFSTFITS